MNAADVYRERINKIADDHQRLSRKRAEGGISAEPRHIEQAVALATGWAQVADGRSIPFDDLDSVVDLAPVAYDTVMRVELKWSAK